MRECEAERKSVQVLSMAMGQDKGVSESVMEATVSAMHMPPFSWPLHALLPVDNPLAFFFISC